MIRSLVDHHTECQNYRENIWYNPLSNLFLKLTTTPANPYDDLPFLIARDFPFSWVSHLLIVRDFPCSSLDPVFYSWRHYSRFLWVIVLDRLSPPAVRCKRYDPPFHNFFPDSRGGKGGRSCIAVIYMSYKVGFSPKSSNVSFMPLEKLIKE